MRKIIIQGNRAAVINEQKPGYVWVNIYVNVRLGFEGADITQLRWTGKTVKGAEKWAAQQLSA